MKNVFQLSIDNQPTEESKSIERKRISRQCYKNIGHYAKLLSVCAKEEDWAGVTLHTADIKIWKEFLDSITIH